MTTPTSAAYSPDGKRIAVGGYDNRVRVWDSQTDNEAISLLSLGTPGNATMRLNPGCPLAPMDNVWPHQLARWCDDLGRPQDE